MTAIAITLLLSFAITEAYHWPALKFKKYFTSSRYHLVRLFQALCVCTMLYLHLQSIVDTFLIGVSCWAGYELIFTFLNKGQYFQGYKEWEIFNEIFELHLKKLFFAGILSTTVIILKQIF